MQPALEVLDSNEWTPSEAAAYVTEPWQNAVESIIETGRRLIEAKQHVAHGHWLEAVALMPFGDSAARKLIQIANHPDLSNQDHGTDLPASWRTLSVLAQLPEGEIPRRIESGDITPELERRQAEEIAAVYMTARQELLNQWSQFVDGLTLALSQAQIFDGLPDLPDNYIDLDEVKTRYLTLGEIINSWENNE